MAGNAPGFRSSEFRLTAKRALFPVAWPRHAMKRRLRRGGWRGTQSRANLSPPNFPSCRPTSLNYSERNSTEFISPERVNFTESFFWIPCDFEGERLHYMLYSWVNRDWLAYLGRQVGQPHKLAKVQMTRFHASDPVYNGPAEGVRVCASVENVGLVNRTHLDLKRICEPEELPFPMLRGGPSPRYCGHRYVYDVVEDRPALNDLVVHWGDHRTVGTIWSGEPSLTFYEAENEEVLPFQPRRMVGGWWYTVRFDHSTSPPKVIHRFGN